MLEARAIPFDVAHAIGNVALALVAGPAMVRMLVRFRERFEWRRGERAAGAARPAAGSAAPCAAAASPPCSCVALVAAGAGPGPGLRGQPRRRLAASRCRTATAASAPRPATTPAPTMTGWAMLGLEAAGRNPLDVAQRRQDAGRLPALATSAQLTSPGDLARTILALEGAGVDPRDFGGRNLVSELLAKRRRDNGSYEGWPGPTAFAVIALRAAGASGGLDKSLAWLREVQNDDGGWGDVPGSPSTADGTGAVMQAIRPARRPSEPRPLLPAPGPAHGRRLPARRQRRRQHPVDRLGGPGDARRRRRPRLLPPRRQQRPRLPRRPARQSDGHYRYSKSTATRPRSGSPARSWSPPPASTSRSRRPPASPKPKQPKTDASSANSGGIPPSRAALARPSRPGTVRPASDGSRAARRRIALRDAQRHPARARSGRSPAARPPVVASPEGDLGTAAAGDAPPRQADGEPASEPTNDSGSSTAGADRPRPARRLRPLRRRPRRPRRLDALALRRSESPATAWPIPSTRWTSRPRSAPAAPTRPSRPEPLPREQIDELLELARWAPNHHLTVPWRFRVVGPAALERLKEAAGPEGAAKLDRAPTLVVVSCRAQRRPGPGRGGPARDRRRLLHRPARRPRPRPRRLLAHPRRCCAARRAAPPSACPPRSASSACSTSATRARSSPPPERPGADRRPSTYLD